MTSVNHLKLDYQFSLLGYENVRRDGTPAGSRVSQGLITIQEWADMQAHPSKENAQVFDIAAALKRFERPDFSDPIITKALRTPDGLNLRALLEGRDNSEDLHRLRSLVKRLLPASVQALAIPKGGAIKSPDPYFLSRLMPVDLDNFDGPDVAAERDEVWAQILECPHIPAAGGSASGEDFWACVAIPKAHSIQEYKMFYWGTLHLLPFLQMRQQPGQDNPNRERYIGTGPLHVRESVVALDRDILLGAYADREHTRTPRHKRVTTGFTPQEKKDVQEGADEEEEDVQEGADDHQGQDDGDWWAEAVSDMVNKVHGNKHIGVYRMGLATFNHGGDYDEYLEKAIAAAGDVGIDAGEAERQFTNGYQYGEKNPSEPSRGRPSKRQDVRNAFSGAGVAECLKIVGYELRWNSRAMSPEVLPFSDTARQQVKDWNYATAPRQPNGRIFLDDGKESFLHDLIKANCRHTHGDKHPVDFSGKNGKWRRCVEAWCETHHADPFREYLEGNYDGDDGDDSDDTDVWVEWFREGYLLEGTHSDEYLVYAARWIIIPCVARAYEAGAIADTMTVLAGGGGMGKGRGVADLFPDWWRQYWFTDAIDFRLSRKELVEAMSSFVLGEIAELSYLTRTEIGASKQLISRVAEKGVRLTFRRNPGNYYRTWHLAGTTNNDAGMGFLPDTENNRRFIIINLPALPEEEAKKQAEHLSAWLKENSDRLWTQGLREYRRNGTKAYTYTPPGEVFEAIRENNRLARKAERAAEGYADLIHANVSGKDIKGGLATIPELLQIAKVMTRRSKDGATEPLDLEEILSEVDRRGPSFVRSIGTELRTARGWESSRITAGPFKGRMGFRPKPAGRKGSGEGGDHLHRPSPEESSAESESSYGPVGDGEDKSSRQEESGVKDSSEGTYTPDPPPSGGGASPSPTCHAHLGGGEICGATLASSGRCPRWDKHAGSNDPPGK